MIRVIIAYFGSKHALYYFDFCLVFLSVSFLHILIKLSFSIPYIFHQLFLQSALVSPDLKMRNTNIHMNSLFGQFLVVSSTLDIFYTYIILYQYLPFQMEDDPAKQYYAAYQKDVTMKNDVEPCSLKELFRFADRKDVLLMVIGTILSLANGVSLLFYAIPFGNLVDAFAPNKPTQQIVEQAKQAVFYFLGNSAAVFVISWFMSATWTITSERQMIRARQAYFSSIMRQEIAWHDRNRPTQVCAKMYIQIGKVHQGLVNNVTSVLTKVSMGASGIIIALIEGWQMALVMIAFLPVMIVAGLVSSIFLKRIQKFQQKTKARLDSQVIEVFDNVRTVRMLDGEEYETERYQKKLENNKEENKKNSIKNKLAFALFFFCILMNYALGFFYGAKLVSEQTINTRFNEPYSVKNVIVIFFTLYMSNLSLSGLPESITSFNISRVSMTRVLHMVDRESRVINGSEVAPTNIKRIRFDQVNFQYQNPLFKDFNFILKPGFTALIGESGSGKTTIINLIMRFYDIFGGSIIFESEGKDYNLKNFTFESLRDRIGYVGQQPVLIGKTLRQVLIAETIPDQQVKKILKQVKAWKFVKDIGLDSQYAMLSGGQKQRIAIARALIQKPQILILDEGTSALDRTTQQQVLNEIKKMRIPFVIMIAHRMETVLNSDTIVKLENGKIVAEGTYKQLVREGIVQQLDIDEKVKEEHHQEDEGMVSKVEKQKESILKLITKEEKGGENNEDESNQDKEELQFHLSYIGRLMKINKSMWYFHLIGIVGSIFIGAIFPTFAYLLSNIIVTISGIRYSESEEQLQGYQDNVQALSLSLFLISIGSLIIVALRGISFTLLTEALGFYLKKNAFKTSINKSMIEIDNIGKQNLANIVTTNCEDLKHLGGHHIGDIFENITTILVGLAISFAFSWQITLISLAIFPLIILSGKLQMAFNHGMQSNTGKVHKKTHQSVIQSVMNIKTIKSLYLQQRIIKSYTQSLDQALGMAIKYGNLSGIMFGIGQTLISCLLALIFYFGALLIDAGRVDVLQVYTSIYAIMFAGVQAGGNMFFLSRLSAAKYAACKYFQIIQNSSNGQQHSLFITNNKKAEKKQNKQNKKIKGSIELHDIEFKYENRETPIFKNFSLKINKGEKVALVGESGSGKSTVTNILFKIYEPVSGQVLIDDKNINLYDVRFLRRQLGIVSQEPALFNRSVYDNIKYNCESATVEDVVKASQMAKAYDFICQGNFGMQQDQQEVSDEDQVKDTEEDLDKKTKEMKAILEKGFKKKVGTKGSYLSGGQKQRIAIARALVRNPSVMVLDEATSALDNQNEKMVQEAIQGFTDMTQIVIAHRLSTVENCDKIVLMKQGKVIEQGKYHELLNKRGYFYNLVNAIKDEGYQASIEGNQIGFKQE